MKINNLLFGQKYNLTEQEKEKIIEDEKDLPTNIILNTRDLSDDEADLEEDDEVWDEDIESEQEESEE